MAKLDIELNDTVHSNRNCYTLNDQNLFLLAKSNKEKEEDIPRYASSDQLAARVAAISATENSISSNVSKNDNSNGTTNSNSSSSTVAAGAPRASKGKGKSGKKAN